MVVIQHLKNMCNLDKPTRIGLVLRQLPLIDLGCCEINIRDEKILIGAEFSFGSGNELYFMRLL